MIKKILVVLGLILIVIQFIRPAKNIGTVEGPNDKRLPKNPKSTFDISQSPKAHTTTHIAPINPQSQNVKLYLTVLAHNVFQILFVCFCSYFSSSAGGKPRHFLR